MVSREGFYRQDVGYYSKALYEDGTVPKKFKDTVKSFIKEAEVKGVSPIRIRKYLANFHTVWKLTKLNLGTTSITTLKDAILKINACQYSDRTKEDLKGLIKLYYKTMLGKGEDYPSCVRWIRTGYGGGKRKLPDDLLKQEEVEAMLKAAKSVRDMALIQMLWESGMRIGELASLQIKHIVFNENGVVVNIPQGKTGSRRILLVESEHHLTNWLAVHPKPDRESFLFVNIEQKAKGEPMMYETVRKVVKNVGARAGIPSAKLHPHNFRHSRASYLAPKLSEAMLCEYFGWVIGSKIPRVYVHLSGKQLDDAILNVYGRKKAEDKKEPRKCFRCKAMNPPESNWCSVCKAPLSLETALAGEEEQQKQLEDTIRQQFKKIYLEEMRKNPKQYLKKT